MATVPETGNARSWWLSRPGLLLLLAILSALPAWWLIAWPLLSFASLAKHAGHSPWVYAHAVGGTGMLVLGAANLYIGSTRRGLRFHRKVGLGYLLAGGFGALSALVLALATVHGKHVDPFAFDLWRVSDMGWALASLALAWCACASMGWRAARNRRYDNHRAWMIRSYVLAWSFVLCRLIPEIPGIAALAELGDGAAISWLSWIVPIGVAEVALQWRGGAVICGTR